MWHEARKQEKKIRGLMVDFKKRAERRREFYEKIKLDPAQFVRANGQPCKINLDPAIALAAESQQTMMAWQGNADNMIDRFDVRAHLDIIPAGGPFTHKLSREEEESDRRSNYERYRILVENECAGVSEEQALQQIYLDEQFGPINPVKDEQKAKLKGKKAAIGYTYEDSTPANDDDDSDSEDSVKEDVETLDLDITLDVDNLTTEQIPQLNACGVQFGMGQDDYTQLLRRDKEDQEELRAAKMLEEEKAQFAGRKSRRERRAYKEKQLAGRKLSPPSYAARASPTYEPYRKSSSRSRSRSRSRSPTPKRKRGRKRYITSFGGNDDDPSSVIQGPVQGPSLPPEMIASQGGHSDMPKHSSTSWDSKERLLELRHRAERSASPVSPGSKDNEYKTRRRPVRSPIRNSRSWERRSRSRGRRSRSRGRRSRSRDRRPGDRYSRDRLGREIFSRDRRSSRDQRSPRDRMSPRDRRSEERRRYGDRRGRYYRQERSRSRSRSRKRYSTSKSRSRSYSKSRSRSYSSSSRSSDSRSPSRSKSKSPSPAKVPVKRYRRDSLSSKSDSSDEDQPAKKTRHQKAPPPPKPLHKSGSSSSVGKLPGIFQPKMTPQDKLKRKMQLALNKQFKADKKAEVMKNSRLVQEKMEREEELRQRAMEMRRKEREKRHDDEYNSGSSNDDSPARKESAASSTTEKSGSTAREKYSGTTKHSEGDGDRKHGDDRKSDDKKSDDKKFDDKKSDDKKYDSSRKPDDRKSDSRRPDDSKREIVRKSDDIKRLDSKKREDDYNRDGSKRDDSKRYSTSKRDDVKTRDGGRGDVRPETRDDGRGDVRPQRLFTGDKKTDSRTESEIKNGSRGAGDAKSNRSAKEQSPSSRHSSSRSTSRSRSRSGSPPEGTIRLVAY